MNESKENPRVAVVVATYNRPHSLIEVIRRIHLQTLVPSRIVVVDASPNASSKKPNYLSEFDIDYLRASVGSLPAQKNMGIDYLLEFWDGDFIQILDDDTLPKPDFLEILAQHLCENPEVVGVSGFCFSEKTDFVTSVYKEVTGLAAVKKRLYSAFGLDGFRPGSVTKAGVGIFADINRQVSTVEWLHGTSMFRRGVFEVIRYRGELPGSALCEDIDFSTRALALGDLHTLANAHIEHEMSDANRPDLPLHYYRFARNRHFLFHSGNFLGLSVFNYVLANFALSISLILQSLLKVNFTYAFSAFQLQLGMFAAFRQADPK